ncbi:MAG: phasin family protein [Betaproteobacteria bacterium]|nr:phasin family protein [Betaproteobacteria bacterium]
MITKPEQVAAAGKAQLDATVRFATIAAEGAEKLLNLQLKNARITFNEAVNSAKALTELKDVSEVASWAGTSFQPSLDKAAAYAKSFYDVATGTQQEISALLEEQVAQFNKYVSVALDTALQSAPAGSEAAVAAAKSVIDVAHSLYDTVSKATKQLSSLTETNVAAASSKKKAS